MNPRNHLSTLILLAAASLPPTLAPAQTTTAAAPPATNAFDKSVDLSVGDHVKVQHLLFNLQQSIVKHNAAAVAALVHYPIKINPGNHPFTIKNPKEFIKEYDRIITADIATVIEKQKYDALFVNSQGAMLGDGEVWITGFCLDKNCTKSDIKIGTIQDTANMKP
jgi:hypothetical protein